MPNTQYFNTWSGTPKAQNNPPVLCSKYNPVTWTMARINDASFTQLKIDLRSVPPPRILTEATGEAAQRGGAEVKLISFPTPGTGGGHPTVKSFYWSDTETNADDDSTTLVPYVQPAGYTYEAPAAGRWMSTS